MDAVEEHAEECPLDEEDDSSYGDAEEADAGCFSDAEDDEVDVFTAGAEVEDLGKRKGTNPARDDLVKRLRDTPPNANTSMGGYKQVPVQPMADYKTYRTKKDRFAAVKREAKDTMCKPVAVPLNQYMGLSLLASKDQKKLVTRLT